MTVIDSREVGPNQRRCAYEENGELVTVIFDLGNLDFVHRDVDGHRLIRSADGTVHKVDMSEYKSGTGRTNGEYSLPVGEIVNMGLTWEDVYPVVDIFLSGKESGIIAKDCKFIAFAKFTEKTKAIMDGINSGGE